MNPDHYEDDVAHGLAADWRQSLPADRQLLFATQTRDWEQGYAMFSVTLNGALTARSQGSLVQARQQVACAADLAERLSHSLLPTLFALGNVRRWRRTPTVEPLQPDLFRGLAAQEAATWNALLHWPLLLRRWQFGLKLRALRHAIERVTGEFCEVAHEIADGVSVHPSAGWQALEALHDDLNTALREAFVVLKSFLCAVSAEGYRIFRTALSLGEAKVKGFPPEQGISPVSP